MNEIIFLTVVSGFTLESSGKFSNMYTGNTLDFEIQGGYLIFFYFLVIRKKLNKIL